MNFSYLFDRTQPSRRNRFWTFTGLTLLVITVNGITLSEGVSVVFSHLFYLPIILAGYWYPRKGILFSCGIAAIYGVMAMVLGPLELLREITIVSRIAIFIIVGTAVSYLSMNLRKSEQQLHDIIEFLPNATFAIDREGMVIAWNHAIEELTGIGKAEMLGRGNYAYAIPFYGVKRPVLVNLIFVADPETEALYPYIKNEAGTYISEVFIPHFHDGKGAHLRITATALKDADGTLTGGIESIRDVTEQVMMNSALQTTSNRLNILAGIIRNDIAKKLAVIYGRLSIGVMKFNDPEVLSFIASIQESANAIQRQVEISREFRDIGTTPPAWIPVQEACLEAAERVDFKNLTFHAWTGRLEIFADPHIPTVFYHLFENSKKERTGADRVVVSYHIRNDGCAIIIEDNGKGIPDPQKDLLFSQRSETYGCGLFLAREILTLTGVNVRETGISGIGTRFEILIPPKGYRIADSPQILPDLQTDDRAVNRTCSLRHSAETGPEVRELTADEFPRADTVWFEYHETKGDPVLDRIFAVILDEGIVSLARCRRHPDGLDVDGIFTPEEHRSKGYSRMAVSALVEACHNDDLYMHAVRSLVPFYQSFGFRIIPERDLPQTIRERYVWAAGNLEGADVQPMHRKAGL
ncbi:MAG: GNAT family N-acetyltransferase [Methanoregula sp.]|jgi:PAS domain-containing protein/GNAT superfamily N-acetyltransferase/two-component sensor histidine kinase